MALQAILPIPESVVKNRVEGYDSLFNLKRLMIWHFSDTPSHTYVKSHHRTYTIFLLSSEEVFSGKCSWMAPLTRVCTYSANYSNQDIITQH